jgi:TonB-linked SusC/RagA family outer membrane protein
MKKLLQNFTRAIKYVLLPVLMQTQLTGLLFASDGGGHDFRATREIEKFEITVAGKVTDANGQSLPGVNVLVKGTSIGTVTDVNGSYTINVPNENSVLVFSFIGYISQEISVNGRTEINVNMAEDVQNLEEVVVVGYGTQKKMNLTGSVESISGEELANRPLPNVGAALSGLSPNLNINLSGGLGGEPGATRSWNIRGMGSINGNTSPLILVDGVEMDINNLDPQNIESVSVLKDASASAIYGARAPFGVVLITTKNGSKDGGVSIQYNTNLAIGTKMGLPHMEDALVYATAYNQASINAGSPPFFSDEHVERIKGFMDGSFPYEYDPENPPNSIWAGRRVGNANYDYTHILLKKYKYDLKHNINVSGGSDKTQYYVSLGFFDEDGFYAYGYDDYKRYDILANLNTEVTDWLRFGLSTKYANSTTDFPMGITTVDRDYFIDKSMFFFAPNTPMYNIDGTIANPLVRYLESSGRRKTTENDLLLSLKAELEPVKGWKTNISYNYNIGTTTGEANPKPIWVDLGIGGLGNVGKALASYESSFTHSPYSLFNVRTSYENTFGDHYFKLMTGYEQEEKFYSRLSATASNLITEEIPSIVTALGAATVEDNKWDWATQGIFGRFNYNFKQKYLLEFSARYNGSSRFPAETRWGFFPSASAGYVLSQESFWSPLEQYINSFKLRASYGELGNQNVSNYLYIPSVGVRSEAPWIIGGERPPYVAGAPALISDGLTWETITTANFGIDAGFLENRLELNLDLFNRKTTNMFGPQETLPYPLGASTPRANNASLETKGFELVFRWRDRLSNDFSYNAQVSLGDNKSTILEYRNENGLINTWYEGKEVGEIWGFVSDGLIQKEEEEMPDQSALHPNWGPGDMKYKDITGDGEITRGAQTLDDHGDLKIIGNSSPRYNIGLTGGFTWKGFDFYMQWYGVAKRDYSPSQSSNTFWGLRNFWGNSAILKETPALDYWRPADETNIFGPNTNSYLPKPYFSSETFKNSQTQTKYLLNAGYFRLRNLQIGYSIPSELSRRVFIQKARIYVSGGNLITLKSLPKAIDPEHVFTSYSTGAIYPTARTFSVGLNVTF